LRRHSSTNFTNSDGTRNNILSSIVKSFSPVISVGIAEERRVSADVVSRANSPDKFLGRMIESEFNSERIVVDSFNTSELKLVDEVFVTNLSKSSSFFSINVDVINKKRSIIENTNTVSDSVKS